MPAPHLPAEIHTVISSYIAQDDLPNYRSASKCFAEIGAKFLFRDLTFHASDESLHRVENVGHHQELRQAVRTIIWDISVICLKVGNFSDWKRILRGLKRDELAALQVAWKAELPDDDAVKVAMERYLRKEYAIYSQSVAEERKFLTSELWKLAELLALFPRLKNIVVTKKQFGSTDMPNEKAEKQSTQLVTRGMLRQYGLPRYDHSEDMMPLVTALQAAQSFTHQIEIKYLNFRVFSQSDYPLFLPHTQTSHITRLNLHFSLTDISSDSFESSMSIMNCKSIMQRGHLKDFLLKFESLQALSLDFEARSNGNGRAPVNLQDVFSTAHAWPDLQELAIYHVDTPAPEFAHFLSQHAGSLKDLALGDICLDPPGSWEALLCDVQPALSLDSAAFKYALIDQRLEDFTLGRSAMLGWYCDRQECVEESSELGQKLERFLVEGGTCPLSEQRKIARIVGRNYGQPAR